MGSTSTMLNVALALQVQLGGKALYFDLAHTGSNVERRLRTIVGEFEEPAAMVERTSLPELPLRLWEVRRLSVDEIADCCRAAAKDGLVAAVVIDNLRLLFERYDKKFDPVRNARDIVSLRSLARELEVPLIAISPLSCHLERREDKRPCLTDFSDIGLPAEAGDRFVAIYRDGYYYADFSTCQPESTHTTGEPTELLCWEDKRTDAITLHARFDTRSGRMHWGA